MFLNFVLGYLALKPQRVSGERAIVDAATVLIKPLQDRIESLEAENAEEREQINDLKIKLAAEQSAKATLQQTVAKLTARIDLLIAQLKAGGITPADFGAGS